MIMAEVECESFTGRVLVGFFVSDSHPCLHGFYICREKVLERNIVKGNMHGRITWMKWEERGESVGE